MKIIEPREYILVTYLNWIRWAGSLHTRGTINLDSMLRKAGITALLVSQYYYRTPPMAYVLQILMVIGIRVDDK